MMNRIPALFSACVALLPVVALGQGEAKQGEAKTEVKQTPPQRVTAGPYQLAADDVISIAVINFANLEVKSLVVPPDGKITVPLLEPISVVGLTTDELARILTEKWKKYVINPSVSVALVAKRKENVVFYGFVGRVGGVEFKPNLHMVEALAEAGGANQTGDLSHVTVTKKTGEKRVLDLSKPETRGGTEADILLEAGDVVYVPERRTQVSVLGELNKPGSFDYKEDMTVLDAIAAAGGVRMETADFDNTLLSHNGVESKLDLDALLKKGDLTQNVKLAAGDRIIIPEFKNRTYTFGAVGKAGYYPYKPGDRVLDALNASGGPIRDADIGKINIVRVDKQKNTATVLKVDIEKALKQGKMEGNIPLQPGDVIYIPDKKHKFGSEDVFRAFGAITGISNLARLLGGI